MNHEPVVVIVDVAVLEGDVLQGERLHPRQLQVAEVRGLSALIPENHFPACYLQLVRSAVSNIHALKMKVSGFIKSFELKLNNR